MGAPSWDGLGYEMRPWVSQLAKVEADSSNGSKGACKERFGRSDVEKVSQATWCGIRPIQKRRLYQTAGWRRIGFYGVVETDSV
jgi:hypothetical protein